MTARLWPVRHGLIRFRLIEHHIEKLAHARLCDGGPAGASDISSEVLFTLIAERYEHRSLGITSNLVFPDWEKVFANLMATASAIEKRRCRAGKSNCRDKYKLSYQCGTVSRDRGCVRPVNLLTRNTGQP